MPHPQTTSAALGRVHVQGPDEDHPPGAYLEGPDGRLCPLEEGWAPRATDVPDLRAQLLADWQPGGTLARLGSYFEDVGATGPPEWERQTLSLAALWYVAAPMCALVVVAATAPGFDDVVLHRDTAPDLDGLVVFESPLPGLDADGSEHPVMTGAMLWGACGWGGRGHSLPAIGITIYRPVTTQLVPVGSLVWPIGMAADEALADDKAKDASMAEDRRRLAALWLLSSQPNLATSTPTPMPRHVVRRAARAGQPPPTVRVVHLRPPTAKGTHQSAPGRHQHVRSLVRGFWREQPYGPGRAQRRRTYIDPYWRGPEDGPVVTSTVVKAFDR